MRPVPFVAPWRLGPLVEGVFDATLVLDDPTVFAGHYPGAPIFPGTFLIEALVQAAGTVVGDGARLEQIVVCRFHSPLLPGDALSAHFTVEDVGAGRVLVEVTAKGRAPAAQLTLLIASAGAENPDGKAPAPRPEDVAPDARALDAAFIERVLPHRPPALLVESARVLEHADGRPELRAFKAITAADASPSASYPQLLVVESFCQSCGLLRAATATASEPRNKSRVPVVAKLADVRFAGDAVVGDRLEHHVKLVARAPDGAVFSGQTVAAGRVILQVARVVAATAPVALLRAQSDERSPTG
jgi:3-hydroxymyristoyl/3-hydroxydecanoyl-(acyl carrier protein) dehydratase